jgi:hypothetical protein
MDCGGRPITREVETYMHLSRINSKHPGQAYIRGIYDIFEVEGPAGRHTCLAQPPLHLTVSELQRQGASRRYNQTLLRETLRCILHGLDFLHNEAQVVHTGMLGTGAYITGV